MTNDTDSPDPAAPPPSAPPSSAGLPPTAGDTPSGRDTHAPGPSASRRAGAAWAPSRRLTAVLAGAMLAVGVAVGAAIGPAPEASFAGASSLPLLSSLIAQARDTGAKTSPASTQPAIAEAPTRVRRHRKHVQAASTSGAAEESSSSTETSGSPSSKSKSKKKATKTAPLPPITKVWLIELSGSTFTEALAAPSTAPYIDSTAIPAGSLLSGWSSLQASGFASDAALIATTEPQLVETILEPLCPEGAAGAACTAGTPGAAKTADEFLSQTLPTITSTPAYRTNGLVVVTFGSTAAGAASGLPSGSTTATLSSQPPAGALLISPFAAAGKRPSTTFKPTSPRGSLEALLHR